MQGDNPGTLGMVVFHTSLLSQMPCAVLLRYPNSKRILGSSAKACSKEERKNLGMQSQESSETNCLIFPMNLVWQLQIVLWMNQAIWGYTAIGLGAFKGTDSPLQYFKAVEHVAMMYLYSTRNPIACVE